MLLLQRPHSEMTPLLKVHALRTAQHHFVLADPLQRLPHDVGFAQHTLEVEGSLVFLVTTTAPSTQTLQLRYRICRTLLGRTTSSSCRWFDVIEVFVGRFGAVVQLPETVFDTRTGAAVVVESYGALGSRFGFVRRSLLKLEPRGFVIVSSRRFWLVLAIAATARKFLLLWLLLLFGGLVEVVVHVDAGQPFHGFVWISSKRHVDQLLRSLLVEASIDWGFVVVRRVRSQLRLVFPRR